MVWLLDILSDRALFCRYRIQDKKQPLSIHHGFMCNNNNKSINEIFPFCPLTLMLSEFSQVQRSRYTGNPSQVPSMCPSRDAVPCSCLDPHSTRPSHANPSLMPLLLDTLLLCSSFAFLLSLSERVHTSGLPLLCDKSHPASWVHFLKVLNGVLEMLLDNRSSLNPGQLDGTPCIAADMQALAVFLGSFLSFLYNI